MGGKKKYIEMFGSFTEPFNCYVSVNLLKSRVTTDEGALIQNDILFDVPHPVQCTATYPHSLPSLPHVLTVTCTGHGKSFEASGHLSFYVHFSIEKQVVHA